ncbi:MULTISPECIES: toxin [Streptomyces]|uniref:toxin n=1 Tax=Streptomyces TaxID=1883 RepID=UPI0004CBFEBA|nr:MULTISPECIES: toxin [Streptomyces]RPK88760.1 hypothetical protein EES46_16545 [Streptomyces sp. ADI98-10]
MRAAGKGRAAGRNRRSQLRRLRKDGARRIAELNLPSGAGVADLCRYLGGIRNRPITLVPLQMPTSHPCGMWVAACDEDLIFYDANTNSAHQEHIILHELGHIICCHRGAGWLDEASARSLFPNVDPGLVRDMLQRTTYDDIQEQEAEVIAYLLSERMSSAGEEQGPAVADGGFPGESAALLRVERTLF